MEEDVLAAGVARDLDGGDECVLGFLDLLLLLLLPPLPPFSAGAILVFGLRTAGGFFFWSFLGWEGFLPLLVGLGLAM
jgi:hypothetical protein